MGSEKRFAILIGSNNYEKEKDKLKFPLKDVEDVENVLVKTANFKSENILKILSEYNPIVPQKDISEELNSCFEKIN